MVQRKNKGYNSGIAYYLQKRRKWSKLKGGQICKLIYNARARAKRYDLKFDLDKKWLEKKIDYGFCEVTGLKFSFKKPRKGYRLNPFSPSLERVKPKFGYTKSNTKVVVWCYNIMKWEWTMSDFSTLIRIVNRGVKRNGKKVKCSKNVALPSRKKN